MSRLDKYRPRQIVKGFIQMMVGEDLSCFDKYTNGEIVKAYTRLMMTCEPKLAILMAQVPIDSGATDLRVIATAICEWCLVGVKPLEGTIFPASVVENVENRLTVTTVDEHDTPDLLVAAFHKAIKWNTPAK